MEWKYMDKDPNKNFVYEHFCYLFLLIIIKNITYFNIILL